MIEPGEPTTFNDLFARGGKTGALIEAFNWSNTAIGPIENWPQSLRIALGIALASKFPMQILWGSEYVQFYNDAYIPIAGAKHPQALGQRACECWAEVWDFVEPLLDQVMTTGEATWSENQQLLLNRKGYLEECYFTFSHTPIRDEFDTVRGIFIAVVETTEQVLGVRRQNRLQGEVEAAKENLERVLASIDDEFMMFDQQWCYTYLNDQAAKTLGKAKTELLGHCIWDLFPDAIGSQFYVELHRAMAEQTVVCFEFFYPPWNRWFENRVYPYPGGLSLFSADITDRKQAEAALQESEERFRVALQGSSIIAFSQDRELRHTWVYNPHPDFSPELILGKTDLEILPKPSSEQLTKFKRSVLESGQRNRAEFDLEMSGQLKTYDIVVEPLQDSAGAIVGIIGSATDITQRKCSEQALRESEERFRQLAENIGAVFFMSEGFSPTSSGRVIYVSPAYEKIWGRSCESLYQNTRSWFEAIHPDDQERVQVALAGMVRAEFDQQFRIIRPDGEIRWVHDRVFPIYNSRGELYRIAGIVEDITERQQAEAEREQLLAREQAARLEAEAVNRIKDEFLAVLSHELRSPLNPILGWAKLLRARQYDAMTTDRALETIERNAKLQAQLVEDLLDVSRILRGKLILNVGSVDLVAMIEAALETVHLAAEAKAIEIQLQLDPNVGKVSGDSSRLQQVVWNLLSNAVKFTPPGGRVEVCLEQVEGTGNREQEIKHEEASLAYFHAATPAYAQIRVTDTGKGIDPEFLPYIFDYFRQEDSATTRAFGGLGLGLAISRHLVELHGGMIAAASPGEDKGATFVVRLPLLVSAPENKPSHTPLVQPFSLQNRRILIAEDEADARELLVLILEQQGAEVIATKSAREALEKLAVFQPDLLLSDIGMPDMDGCMLVQQIRCLPPAQGGQVLAIALTAYASEADRQRALAAGFQEHICKPIDPADLIAVVASLLSQTSSDSKTVSSKSYSGDKR